jgi:hypothetical protein
MAIAKHTTMNKLMLPEFAWGWKAHGTSFVRTRVGFSLLMILANVSLQFLVLIESLEASFPCAGVHLYFGDFIRYTLNGLRVE